MNMTRVEDGDKPIGIEYIDSLTKIYAKVTIHQMKEARR